MLAVDWFNVNSLLPFVFEWQDFGAANLVFFLDFYPLSYIFDQHLYAKSLVAVAFYIAEELLRLIKSFY